MQKYNHAFTLSEQAESYRIYNCADKEIRLDFIGGNVMRFALYNSDKKDSILPTFLIDPENKFMLCGRDRLSAEGFEKGNFTAEKKDGKEVFTLADGITAELETENFLMKYYKDGKLIFSDRAPLAYNLGGEFGDGQYHYVSRENGEKIFGLGDKGGALNKYGRSFKIEATDCMGFDASSSDPLYKHVPFYICSNSVGTYGILYDTSDSSYFDFGREINNYYEPYKYFKTEDDTLVYYVIFGSVLDIVKNISVLCGRQAFPPKWSFDYCASTMAYTDAERSEELMNGFLGKVKSTGLSCKGFYLSSGYTSIGAQRYVFNWNREKFPDPARFVRNFKEKGIEIIPNIKPAFLTSHPMYGELEKRGLFVKNADGTPFITQFWDGYGSYLDFTNREAFDFWAEQVKDKLLAYGMSATWNDNNEFDIKDNSAVCSGFGKGRVQASRIRNTLTYLMNASSYTAQTENEPEKRPFLSSRCSNMAVRRLAQTWSGDNRTEFRDLRYCNYIGLNLSLSGFEFYGHDLGGFTGDMPSRELLLRWLQLGVFQPRFTIHSWNKDGSATMPWSYEDILPYVREIFAQRREFMPYMYNCAYLSASYGLPVNAPVFLYYPDDKSVDCESDSFMFGRDILVTPVLDEGAQEVSVYLPQDDSWYVDGALLDGGRSVKYSLSAYGRMKYAVRAGSVIPTDADAETVFTVYPVSDGSFVSDFFDDDGVSYKYLDNECVKLRFEVECDESSVTVCFKNLGKIKMLPKIKLVSSDLRKLTVKEI